MRSRFALLLACSLFATGCWDRVEVNEIGISIAAALDAEAGNKVRFSEQIALPGHMSGGPQSGPMGGGGGGGKPFYTFSSTGINLRDAMQNFQTQMSRRLFTAHRRIFLISDEIAKKGVTRYLDELGRDPETRLRTSIAVTEGPALDYLKVDYPFERVPAEGLRKALFGQSSQQYQMDCKEFMILVSTPGTDAFLPLVKMESPLPGSAPKFKANGLAIFKEGKMIGSISTEQAKGVLWLRRKFWRDTVTVDIPGESGQVSCELLRMKSAIHATMKDGHPAITAEFNPESEIYENETDLDLSKTENIDLVQQQLSATLKKRIEDTLDTLQHQYQADIIGFGDEVHHAYPKQWQQLVQGWDEEFAKIPVTVQVSSKIRRTGMTGPSPAQQPGEQEEVRR